MAAAARYFCTAGRLHHARRGTRRRPHPLRARLGPPQPPGGALLHGHQPLDGERLCQRLRSQSAARRARHRASAAPRLADGDAQYPHRVARGSIARPRRPHDRRHRDHRPGLSCRRSRAVPPRPGVGCATPHSRNGDFRAGAPMDVFVLIVLLLLAAPIIGIVALIRSITDRNLLRQLDARVKALEGARVAAGAATPATAEPTPAPATIVVAPVEPAPSPAPPTPPPTSVPLSSPSPVQSSTPQKIG